MCERCPLNPDTMSDRPPSPRRPSSREDDDRGAREWNRMSQLVFEFLAYMAVLGYLGWSLDQRYGWNGRGVFVGLILALICWVYRVLRVTRNLFK
jgi:F0F1-type ATP synthase assembly protein I